MATEQSGFPTLIPALITKVNIGDVNPLGLCLLNCLFLHRTTG